MNIDHHAGNTRFGDINWIEPECAAVGEMIYYLALDSDVPVNPEMAGALLLAIMTDTGSFRHANVRPRHLKICGRLLELGADLNLVTRAAYGSRSAQSVEMVGLVLSHLHYEGSGRLAWGELRRADLDRLGGPAHLPGDLCSELRSIKGVEIALLFTELPGGIRASLRSSGDRNVDLLARVFGGGGHPLAAGLTLQDVDYSSTRDRIVAAARNLVESSNAPLSPAP